MLSVRKNASRFIIKTCNLDELEFNKKKIFSSLEIPLQIPSRQPIRRIINSNNILTRNFLIVTVNLFHPNLSKLI
jgi:hypothetical protein